MNEILFKPTNMYQYFDILVLYISDLHNHSDSMQSPVSDSGSHTTGRGHNHFHVVASVVKIANLHCYKLLVTTD